MKLSRSTLESRRPESHAKSFPRNGFVSRAGRRPNSDVFAWSIRRPLPIIPIPLLDPDPDVHLDLAAVFAQTYDDAPYGDSIDYSAPLEVPLAPEDRAWAEHLARARGIEPRAES